MALGDLEPAVWRIDIYEFKPATPYAGAVTDLSNLYTSDLSITKQRNYPDEIRFTLDLGQLEVRAQHLNIESKNLLEPYKHKVRCYRNNKFVAQGIVVKTTANLNNQSKNTLEVQCVDTLGLFEKRLIHQDYGEGSWADFAKEVVMDAQHEPNRIYNYAWEGDGTSIDNAWFRGWKYTPGESAIRDFPEWEPNHLYSMYDTCTHDAKFWEAKEHAFYSGETFSESNWTLLGILDSETGDVAGVYGVWREDDEEPGPTGTALGGWGGTSSCHMSANTFAINNGAATAISLANSQVSTSLVAPYYAQPRLPQEYQEVAYIESDGTQWIDTKYTPTQNTTIQIKVMPLELTGGAILGTLNSTDDVTDYRFFNSGGIFYFDIPGGSGSGNRISGGSCPANIQQEIELGDFYIKYTNGSNILTGTAQNFTASGTLALNTNASKANISSNRWYYVKIFENGELILNLIPSVRKSDNVVGMYDTVSETFFSNDGLGTFLAGETINYSSRLPKEYVETQYLESTYGSSDSSQLCPYIDTGLNAREYGEHFKIDTVLQVASGIDTASAHGIVAVRRGVVNGTMYYGPEYLFYLGGSGIITLVYTTSAATQDASYSSINTGVVAGTAKRHIIVDSLPNTPTITVDGTKYTGSTARATGSKYGPSATLSIFAFTHQSPGSSGVQRQGVIGCPMKLYSMKIYGANDVVLRNYVPCIRVSDSKPGLYDMEHGKFYSNANASSAGDFTAGPIVSYDDLTVSADGIKVVRDTSMDLVRGNVRAMESIDVDKVAEQFAKTYPDYVANGYGPLVFDIQGYAEAEMAGTYSCNLYVAPFGGSGNEYVTICSGASLEQFAATMEAWGVTINTGELR